MDEHLDKVINNIIIIRVNFTIKNESYWIFFELTENVSTRRIKRFILIENNERTITIIKTTAHRSIFMIKHSKLIITNELLDLNLFSISTID